MVVVQRVPEVSRILAVSSATLRRMVKAGKFPAPFAIGSSSSLGWRSTTVEQWLESRMSIEDADRKVTVAGPGRGNKKAA